MSFEQDILSRDTNLFPIVDIGYATIGDELMVNLEDGTWDGHFDDMGGWSNPDNDWNIGGGMATFDNDSIGANASALFHQLSLASGTLFKYRITFEIIEWDHGEIRFTFGTIPDGGYQYSEARSGVGVYTQDMIFYGAAQLINFAPVGGGKYSITNVSIKRILGDVSGKHLSTNSVTLNGQYYKPLLLNVPSLKESIDLEKRNYKISNVTLNISNIEHDGERFSEMVADTSLINQSVHISWVSQSGQKLIYQGQIRRYEHDDEKVKLTVEDSSQEKLHKDLPFSNNYLTEETVPEYNLNKPIPQVYGHVDRSPCIISSSPFAEAIGSKDTTLLLDSSDVVKIQELYVFKDQAFIATPSVVDKYFDYFNGEQWQDLDNVITFEPYGSYVLDGGDPEGSTNAINFNNILAHAKVDLSEAIPANGSLVEGTANRYDGANTTVIYDGDVPIISGTIVREPNIDSWNGESLSTGYAELHDFPLDDVGYIEVSPDVTEITQMLCNFPILIPLAEHTSGLLQEDGYLSGTMKVGGIGFANFQYATAVNVLLRMGGAADGDYVNGYANTSMYVDPPNNPTTNYPGTPSEPQYSQISVNEDKINQFRKLTFYIYPYDNAYDGGLGMIMECHDVYVDYYAELEELHKLDFYADVKGRAMVGENSPTAPQLIKNLMEGEFGVTGILVDNTYDWQYAFTINEKINSKKLIEGIASASPYIPRFNNMGVFKFDVIKSQYELGDIVAIGDDDPHHVKESDVIDFSFSRTKVEDVYTKVDFKYNWNYAREEFDGHYVISIEGDALQGIDSLSDSNQIKFYYGREFYGLAGDDDSTLVIDDDRGKYIRDVVTAKSYAKWMLLWHCNQHLKIKVKLPLKYLGIEIGSLIKFDKVLGGVKPYGIDYHAEEPMAMFTDFSGTAENNIGALVNASQAYPLFICVSTNKTLEFVEIEVIQLHNLNDGVYTRESALFGCMNPTAWNYNFQASEEPENSCVFTDNYMASDCPLEANPSGELDPNADGIPDYSENYTGDENLFDDDGNPLPTAFIIHDETDPVTGREAVIAAAREWYDTHGQPLPNTTNAPIIYDYTVCNWLNIQTHTIKYFRIQLRQQNGAWQSPHSLYNPESGLVNGQPPSWNNNINGQFGYIELNHWQTQQLSNNGGMEVKITWELWFQNSDAPGQIPTFSNDSTFNHSYTADGISVAEGVLPANNMFNYSNAYEQDYFFDNSVMGLAAYIDSEVMVNCNMIITSNPQYMEIPNTYIPIRFKQWVFQSQTCNLMGDISPDGGDGIVNIFDVMAAIAIILGSGDTFPACGDMNGDGGMNILDVMAIINIIIG